MTRAILPPRRISPVFTREGRGVEADPAMAQTLYLQAAQGGIGSAKNSLGVMARDGTLGQKNMAEAARWFRRASEAGDVDGNVQLRHAPHRGQRRRAGSQAGGCKLFGKAAALGNLRSKVWLGEMYANGAGVGQKLLRGHRAVRGSQRPANDARAIQRSRLRLCRGPWRCTRHRARREAMFERAGGSRARATPYYNLARLYEDGKTGAAEQRQGRGISHPRP
jgi:TPR repeat protein